MNIISQYLQQKKCRSCFFPFSFFKKKEKEKNKIPEQNMQEANITKNLLHVIRPQALHINIAGAISRFHSWISYHDKWSVGVWNSYLSAANRGTSLGEKNGGFKSERQKKNPFCRINKKLKNRWRCVLEGKPAWLRLVRGRRGAGVKTFISGQQCQTVLYADFNNVRADTVLRAEWVTTEHL